MRFRNFFLTAAVVLAAILSFAQEPQPVPVSQNTNPVPTPAATAPATSAPTDPALTVEEKVALATDDIRRQDILEKLNKELQEQFKPVNDHQTALIKTIEDAHPGWKVEQGGQGWHLTRKTEDKKPAAPPVKKESN